MIEYSIGNIHTIEAIITNHDDFCKPIKCDQVSKRRASIDRTKEWITINSEHDKLYSTQSGNTYSDGECVTLQEFMTSIRSICNGAGIVFDLLNYQRADFKFDAPRETQANSAWVKYCNLLIATFDAMWKCAAKNRDFRQAGQCGAYKGSRAQRGRFEIIHYDKDGQKHSCGIPFRLELRCLDLNGHSIEKGLLEWCSLLQKVKAYYNGALERLNIRLVKEYESAKACLSAKGKLKVNTFLILHKDAVYSRQQLLQLYDKLGDCNSKKALDQYYQITNREARLFITQNEFNAFVDRLCEGIMEYLNIPLKTGVKPLS